MRNADRRPSPSALAVLALLLLALFAHSGSAGAQAWCVKINPVPPFEPPPEEPDNRCEPDPPPDGGDSEDCNNCKGSPCYVASGVFATRAVDLELSTAGFPLLAMRKYESTQLVDGPLGYGWTSGLTSRLYYTTYALGPGTVQKMVYVIVPSGARFEFKENPDGTFSPPAGRYDALVRNGDGSFELWAQRSSSSLHFGAAGELEAMVDEHGNELVFLYDPNGRLERVADASGSGRYLDVYWGADGRISNVVDSAGRQVGYTYSAEGMLTEVVDPVGRITRYDYAEGRHTPLLAEVRDHWNRVVTTVVFDDQDRVTSYSDQGETYTYTYNYQNDPSLTAKTDTSGNTRVYTHGEGGLILEREAPGGATSRHTEYYPDGSIMLEVDEVGVATSYTYDSEGRILSVTQDDSGPEAVRFEYEYDTEFPDRVASITPRNSADDSVNPHWQAWRYDYYDDSAPAPGALHRVHRVRADGSTLDTLVTYEYDSSGRPTATIDAAGGQTDYVYDAQGNLVTVRAPANNVSGIRPETHYGHDAAGRVTSATDPMGSVTTYTHDAAGRILTVTLPPPEPGSPLDFTTTYTYDQFDAGTELAFTHVADPNGHVTKQGYDQHGRLVEAHDALGAVTRYTYANGLLASISDAHGNVTSNVYDSLRRLQETIFPDGAVESYTYHGDGQLARKTDRKGQMISYAYDPHKRLKTKSYPGGSSITYTHQGQKLMEVVDTSTSPSETHTFVYDNAYRVVSNTQGPRGTIDYTYTATDQVASYSVLGGPTTSYTYYPDQSVHTIQWTPVAGEFHYTYTLRGQYEAITFPNGQQRLHSYDGHGRLLELANVHPTAGNLATYAYGYDTNHFTGQPTMLGQRTTIVANVLEQGLLDALTKYYYDAAYQLVRADYPPDAPFSGEVHEWTYDLIGNRLTDTVDGATNSYAYDNVSGNQNNWIRLLSDGVNTYSYDPNGNTTTRTASQGNQTYSWDSSDRLIEALTVDSGSFSYDHSGRRIRASTSAGISQYLYNGFDIIRDQHGITTDFLFGTDLDEPLALSSDGQVSFMSTDALGSIALVSDDAGGVRDSYVYDAWGVTRSSTATTANLFTYTAREIASAGLLYFRARYYSPELGRFHSEDPLVFGRVVPGESRMDPVELLFRPDVNLILEAADLPALSEVLALFGGDEFDAGNVAAELAYAYAANDPVAYIDPMGEAPWLRLAPILRQAWKQGKRIRCKKPEYHPPTHPFRYGIGKRCHFQWNCYIKGKKGSRFVIRIPVPCCGKYKDWGKPGG